MRLGFLGRAGPPDDIESATVSWLNVDFMTATTPPWIPILRSLRRSEYPLRVGSLSSIWL